MKKSGLEIKDIKQFMDWCVECAFTYLLRKSIFKIHKEDSGSRNNPHEQILDMLKFKYWYYEQATQDGSKDRVQSMIPDGLPDDIQKAYENVRHS